MIARLIASLLTVLALTITPTQAAPSFPALDPGFTGTMFRGVALGQSRAQVEVALAENGFRCLTPEEDRFSPEESAGYTTCGIVGVGFVLDNVTKFEIDVRYDLTQKLGLPYYAVSFVDDVASAITLDPSYFNAGGTTPYLFAEQINDNYGVVDGMTRYGTGWRGMTANNEQVLIQTVYNGQVLVLVVMATTDHSTPTFD